MFAKKNFYLDLVMQQQYYCCFHHPVLVLQQQQYYCCFHLQSWACLLFTRVVSVLSGQGNHHNDDYV